MNSGSEISSAPFRNAAVGAPLSPRQVTEENDMTKFGYIFAGVMALAISAPSIASAETTVIKSDHVRGARAEMGEHHDHGMRHHDRKVLIIKHRHHHED
jgi:hypothetical protein